MKKSLILLALCNIAFAANITFKEATNDYQRINPATSPNTLLSFSSSIGLAKKSVVNVATSRTIKRNISSFNPFSDPFFEDFFGFKFNNPKNNEQTQKSTAIGSGVIISNDGYIITNNHVIEGSDEIIITMFDNSKEYKAKLIGSDPKTDLAILKVNGNDFQAISFADSSKLLEGDLVFAIGNPFGVGGSVTSGIISALNKDDIGLNQYEDFIQTDASINPGNSGGALVDSRGALVGINSAILTRSGGNNGIGFAIPSNMVKEIASKLIKDGKISRGFIGVSIGNLTSDQKEVYKSQSGALVMGVLENSPAQKAGIKRGDLIIKINDKNIDNASALKNYIGALKPDSVVSITYERARSITSVKLRLTDLETEQISTQNESINGLEVSNLNSDLIRKYKLEQNAKGVIVTSVKENSSANKTGFLEGDLIVQVNEKSIENISELKDEIAKSTKQDRRAMIWIMRSGVIMALVLK